MPKDLLGVATHIFKLEAATGSNQIIAITHNYKQLVHHRLAINDTVAIDANKANYYIPHFESSA